MPALGRLKAEWLLKVTQLYILRVSRRALEPHDLRQASAYARLERLARRPVACRGTGSKTFRSEVSATNFTLGYAMKRPGQNSLILGAG